jgi:hypothetical protein
VTEQGRTIADAAKGLGISLARCSLCSHAKEKMDEGSRRRLLSTAKPLFSGRDLRFVQVGMAARTGSRGVPL